MHTLTHKHKNTHACSCMCLSPGRAAADLAPLLLVVHNIDGPALRSSAAQAALATLAAHPRVALVASVDHLNASLRV
jgi:hypothetical protein